MLEKMSGLSPDFIIHPGETIKELLEDRNMSQEELAIRTGVSPKHVSEVVRGKKNISARFAVKLEYAFNIPASFWINLQGIYDKETYELAEKNNIEKKEFDVLSELKEIVEYCENENIISADGNNPMKVLEMRKFLNINDLTSIPNLPLQQVAFRGSTATKVNIYVLYAWQCLCQYFSSKVEIINDFNKNKLIESLDKIKQTMHLKANDMVFELTRIFSECGVSFSVVKHFKGAPVQGYINKKDGRVSLCMTIRQSFCDIFWFTLFHEICHLINEDFSDFYIDYTFIDSEIERKADKFARDNILNEEDYNDFIRKGNLNLSSVREFARSQGVLPGIVIGRIQNDKKDYTFLAHYREQYKWSN